jgi:hypothetical protein
VQCAGHDRRQILHVALPARLHLMHRQLDHSTLLQLAFGELKGSLMASHPHELEVLSERFVGRRPAERESKGHFRRS